jgi:large subunit ribosomal protein L29
MKVDELRVLAEDELDGRMRAARRELYELRFKHAVGQLENSSQISKVRHDIARIMTVQRERDYGISAAPALEEGATEVKKAPAADEGFEPLEGEEAPAAVAAETKPKRGRKAKAEPQLEGEAEEKS